MISLSYSPAYDPYHTIFRNLVLLEIEDIRPLEVEAVRILDFYICFPQLVGEFRADKKIEGQTKKKNLVEKNYVRTRYNLTPPSSVLFYKMKPTQFAALSALSGAGYVDKDTFRAGRVQRSSMGLSDELSVLVEGFLEKHSELIEFIKSISNIQLYGSNGLKSRSELLEARYDNV